MNTDCPRSANCKCWRGWSPLPQSGRIPGSDHRLGGNVAGKLLAAPGVPIAFAARTFMGLEFWALVWSVGVGTLAALLRVSDRSRNETSLDRSAGQHLAVFSRTFSPVYALFQY
jgi:hypothetical protein